MPDASPLSAFLDSLRTLPPKSQQAIYKLIRNLNSIDSMLDAVPYDAAHWDACLQAATERGDVYARIIALYAQTRAAHRNK